MDFAVVVVLLVIAYFFFVHKKGSKGKGMSGGGGGRRGKYNPGTPYIRRYTPASARPASKRLPAVHSARGETQGAPECKFLLTAKEHLARDYVLVIDRSGSMSVHGRWKEAEQAVQKLAPYICKFDPDGVDIFLFDHQFQKFGGVKSAEEVKGIFSSTGPRGSTDLAQVLNACFEDHFAGDRGATSILVVTDGSPDSRKDVEDVIVRAANSIAEDEELSVSFLQIGDDGGAAQFLAKLDDDLEGHGAKFDIVDTIPFKQAHGMSFNEIIANSLFD